MRRSLQTCWLLLLAAFAAQVASAQSPRADIAWLAGGHLSPISSVAYSPDGTVVAASGYFGDTMKLWRASDGMMIRTFGNTSGANQFIFGPMLPITFTPDGRTIIALGEGSAIGVWNVADGKLLRIIHVVGPDLALSPDGTLIAVAANDFIKLVRFSDGAIVRSIPWPSDFVQRVAFSPDGNTVAGGDRVGTLRTFRVADGGLLWSIPAHPGDINALRYSPDGTRIATGSADDTIKLWNSTNGDPAGTLVGHTDNVGTLAFSPNGTLLASGSNDNTVKLWSIPSGALVGTLAQPTDVGSVSFNPAGNRLALACDSDLREWDVPSQTLVRSLLRASERISRTVFTPDSTKLVAGGHDGKVSVYDVATGGLLRQMTPGGNIFAVAASATMVAAGTNIPNVIQLYRLKDGAFVRTLTPPGSLPYTYSTAFSPDGATLASAHFNQVVRLWNVSDGSLLRTLTGPTAAVNGVAYTSDASRVLAASSDGFVYVWDTGGTLIRSMGPAGQELSSLAISPDNQFVLAAGRSGQLQLWRVDNGAFVYGFSATGGISDVRFTPSGFAFYATRQDGSLNGISTLRVYRTSDHALLETYSVETGGFGNSPTGPLTIDVSRDGKRLTYGRDDATVVMAYNTLIAAPTSATLFMGQLLGGSFQDLVIADGVALVARPGFNGDRQSAPLQIDVRGHSSLPNPTGLSFQLVASANMAGVQQEVWMRNAQSGAFELVDTHPATTTDQTVRVDLGPNFARFIDPAGDFLARLKWNPLTQTGSRSWQVSVDQAVWAAGL